MDSQAVLNSVMEYCSAFKRNLLLIHETNGWVSDALSKWKKPDSKTAFSMIPFMWHACKGKSQRTDIRLRVTRAAPRGTRHFGAYWGCAVSWYSCLLCNCIFIKTQRSIHRKGWISLYINCVLIFNKDKKCAHCWGETNVSTKNKPD